MRIKEPLADGNELLREKTGSCAPVSESHDRTRTRANRFQLGRYVRRAVGVCRGGAVISFKLPFPPSVNSYWRHIAKGPLAGRVLISAKGREYRTDCEHAVLMQRVQRGALKGRLAVSLVANVPDKRVRDLDNMLKSSLDAIKHCGVINDDGDIDKITIERGPYVKGGEMLVSICEANK